jgi:hypothetical protein
VCTQSRACCGVCEKHRILNCDLLPFAAFLLRIAAQNDQQAHEDRDKVHEQTHGVAGVVVVAAHIFLNNQLEQ